MIHLRESDHTYWRQEGGAWHRVPGVNEIVRAVIPDAALPFYTAEGRERGTVIHECLELWAKGGVNYEDVDADVIPYVEQGIEAMTAAIAQPRFIEQNLYHPRHRFAGRPDFVGGIFGQILDYSLSVIDYKSGSVPKIAGLTTAGYRLLAEANTQDQVATWERYALHLLPNRFKMIPLHTAEEAHMDERRFLAALDLYRAFSFREDRIGERNVEPYDPTA